MQRLNGIDSLFISLESSTNLFHVGAIAVLDPSTAPEAAPAPYEAFRSVVQARMHKLDPLRKKLVQVPAGLDHPVWVDDPQLDLERHLLRGALPSPGGETELARYAAQVLSHPLDRRRPLWEIHTVEGLEGGLIAGIAKIHHSLVDGISGTDITGQLMDLAPEATPDGDSEPQAGSDETVEGEQVPGPLSLLREAALNAGRRAVPTLQGIASLSTAAIAIRNRNRRLDTITPPSMFSGPRTRLASALGTARVAGICQVDRADVDVVRAATGAKVNDVILALTSAALRSYMLERGELPGEPLTGFVPVSVRPPEEHSARATNQLSGMLVSLATDVHDPLVRLLNVMESTESAKDQDRIMGPDVMSRLTELAVPAVLGPVGWLARATGLTTRRPPFSVVVSSFPGPPFPLYCAGSEMLSYHPFGPVIDGSALNVTAMSYKKQIGFGLLADSEAVPDVQLLARFIPDAMRELAKAVAD